MKVRDLSWPALILLLIGVFTALFAAHVAYWWAAHQLAWWTFSLFAAAVTMTWAIVSSTVKVLRERRKRP